MWVNPAVRAWISPAKDVISGWNSLVGDRGGRIVTAAKLAATLKGPEIAPEMRDFLLGVEADLLCRSSKTIIERNRSRRRWRGIGPPARPGEGIDRLIQRALRRSLG